MFSFSSWFAKSVVSNDDGSPLIVYHGSIDDFDVFDKSKIRLDDLDAPFNGFWFSTDPHTSPAMRNAKYVKSFYLSLQNPAPYRAWNLASTMAHNALDLPEGARSAGDAARMLMQSQGFDGVVWRDVPKLDREAYERNGVVEFYERNRKKALVRDEEFGGCDYYDVDHGRRSFVTGYESIDDFLRIEYAHRVYVVFEPSQIRRAIF